MDGASLVTAVAMRDGLELIADGKSAPTIAMTTDTVATEFACARKVMRVLIVDSSPMRLCPTSVSSTVPPTV